MTESVYEWKNDESITENTIKNDNMILDDDPLGSFLYALKSSEAKRQYPARLMKFFDYLEIDNTPLDSKDKNAVKTKLENQARLFLEKGKTNEKWALNSILRFLEYLKTRQQIGEIKAGTIKNYYRSIKLFCEMNDLSLRWKRIAVGLPKARNSSNDRTPTIEEIRKLVDYPDRRIKVIVSMMMSSGIRLGAWDYLRLKDVIPMLDEKRNVVAAKLIVYSGEPEEYLTFISSEAYNFLNEWIEFRRSYGEQITENSWIMRDIWQTTNVKYGANWGLATIPKKLESVAIKRIIDRALRIQGIRHNLTEGQKRHEFKAMHGFRKYFKSRAEQRMRPINVEILMGHSVGVSDSYYRPQEKEILDDYLKAVDDLLIYDNKNIQKEIEDLRHKNENNEYIIRSKLQEKDDAYIALSDQVMRLMDEIQLLKNSNQGSINP
ncbi:MAG: hypothetical protein L0H53_10620 [Candidatus Nitrosocosmicus sp.]|nr:hypothetical protein [Candidatus Nitrosocosmicus sp.]MDN5867858.1 hypothetical protein [Candidatus Nitrosocosmicus sp.]